MRPLIVITCGPASEPVDAVRRITNFSTGELGVRLAGAFAGAGCRVICLKGIGATWPDATAPVVTRHFIGNDNLLGLLGEITEPVEAVYHAAALTDFAVDAVLGADGRELTGRKISSDMEGLTIRLRRAGKLLPGLRGLFPGARIVGWKYEMEGGRDDALEAGRRQMANNGTEACVVNGEAFGPGFGWLTARGLEVLPDKEALCTWLVAEAAQGRNSRTCGCSRSD